MRRYAVMHESAAGTISKIRTGMTFFEAVAVMQQIDNTWVAEENEEERRGMKMKFYYTYGSSSETQPFRGGWSIVEAYDRAEADRKFRRMHPSDGMLRCAGVYTEDEFMGTRMSRVGNFGKYCVEMIG